MATISDINSVLLLLGRYKVSSIDEDAYSIIISDTYNRCLLELLEEYSFSAYIATSKLIRSVTHKTFKYTYTLPTNYIRFVQAIYYTEKIENNTVIETRYSHTLNQNEYDIDNEGLQSNYTSVLLRYVTNTLQNPKLETQKFKTAVAYLTAREVCIPLTENPSLFKYYAEEYERYKLDAINLEVKNANSVSDRWSSNYQTSFGSTYDVY